MLGPKAMMSRKPSYTSARLLGLCVATTSACGSAGSVPVPDAGPTYGQLSDESAIAWSTPLGPSAVTPKAVAAAPDGTVRIAATLSGDVTLGGTTLATAGGQDVLVAELGADGEPLWAHDYGDSHDQSASGAVVDADGNVVVVGTFAGTLDFQSSVGPALQSVALTSSGAAPGTSAMVAAGASDAFVAKLDPAGNLVWSADLGRAGATTNARSVALGPNGAIALTGEVGVGVEPKVLAGSADTDAFVALLDDSGHLQWMKSFGGSGPDAGTSVAVNARGELVVTGTYEGAIDFGAGPLPTFGGRDVFLAKLDAQGTVEWTKAAGGATADDAVGVAFDPSGDVISLGNYSGIVSFDSALASDVTAGPGRLLLAKYGPSGDSIWAQRFGSGDPLEQSTALGVDGQGDAYIAGQLHASFDFGACNLAPTSAVKAGQSFVVMTTSAGKATCGRRYGLGPEAEIVSLGVAPVPGVVLTGVFEGSIDLGQGRIAGNPSASFVAREEPIPQPLL